MFSKIVLSLSLCCFATTGLTGCDSSASINSSTGQSTRSTSLQGEIVLPYAANEDGFETQQVVVVPNGNPALRVSINDLYTLEAVIDGKVSPITVTNVRVDPITGQTYITYTAEGVSVFNDTSILEVRTVNGYWLGGSVISYTPGVLVVDITPQTSLDVVLAREGRIPGALKIGDLSRVELWALGFDPDTVNTNASIRSLVKSNGEVKANKLAKNGRGNGKL